LGYLPAIAVAFSATLPVLLIAGYAGARVIDEPAARLADRFAVWMLALGPASAWPACADAQQQPERSIIDGEAVLGERHQWRPTVSR
jgi:hypothetical protein